MNMAAELDPIDLTVSKAQADLQTAERIAMMERLDDWMAWCLGKDMNKLDYPAAVSFARFLPGTTDREHRPIRRVAHNPHRAYATEVAVNQLPERQRHIVRVHYRYKHLYSVEVQLKILASKGIALQRSRYYEVLRHAETMIKNILTRADK